MPFPALLLVLAAGQTPAPVVQPFVAPRHYGRPFISPMGEPFRASAGGDGLAAWFAQADRNHDGILTAGEMLADSDRFFATLDTDHDGELDPDEVTHYETVLAPEVQGEPAAMRVRKRSPDDPAPMDSDSMASDFGLDGPQGAGRFALLNIPEPVAAADMDLNRSISRDEFRNAAIRRFQLLDTNHNGRLTLAQLDAMRPSLPLAGFRHHRDHRHTNPSDGQQFGG